MKSLLHLTLALAVSAAAFAETVVLEPARDATLIEDVAGSRANGSGPSVFAGRTSEPDGSVRRALVAFDVSAYLPAGATITAVRLTMRMNQGNTEPLRLSLHRIVAEWSEGPSSSPGGIGAPAEPGDTTWIHTTFDEGFWGTPGGDTVASSASAVVGGPAEYTWSTKAMIADVQRWLDDPVTSHGWMLRGDESSGSTAKRFDSREQPDATRRPRLVVTFVVSDDEDDDERPDPNY